MSIPLKKDNYILTLIQHNATILVCIGNTFDINTEYNEMHDRYDYYWSKERERAFTIGVIVACASLAVRIALPILRRSIVSTINTPDTDGDTPLIDAAIHGSLWKARLLLFAGANIHHSNVDGVTALMVAIVTNNLAMARLLLGKGADPNQIVGDNGSLPLHMAASEKNDPMYNLLLEFGANPISEKVLEELRKDDQSPDADSTAS